MLVVYAQSHADYCLCNVIKKTYTLGIMLSSEENKVINTLEYDMRDEEEKFWK